jgi:hypothetical protein
VQGPGIAGLNISTGASITVSIFAMAVVVRCLRAATVLSNNVRHSVVKRCMIHVAMKLPVTAKGDKVRGSGFIPLPGGGLRLNASRIRDLHPSILRPPLIAPVIGDWLGLSVTLRSQPPHRNTVLDQPVHHSSRSAQMKSSSYTGASTQTWQVHHRFCC